MKNSFRRMIRGLMLPLLIVALACSLLPNVSSTPGVEPEYRYDNLPIAGNEEAAISEYRAISQWNKLDINYFFINGTGKLEGDGELELVRQAFALWAQDTP